MWAIVTVTKNGVSKAIQVKEMCDSELSIDIYTIEKYKCEGVLAPTQDLKELILQVYSKYKTILFIMASGIVVRMIAPLIQSKIVDPAVLVMDDKGENIISLLSGHVGGANEKAKVLAKIISARPIITTSSDVNNKIAVDTFAMRHKLFITDFTSAKEVTALIINEEKVCIINNSGININKECLCENLTIDDYENYKNYEGAIIISQKSNFDIKIPYVHLVPQDIILGIGCRKNTKTRDIIEFINTTMKQIQLHIKSIRALSTVDVKQYEIGILETKEHFGVDLDIIYRDEIALHQNKFKQSSFVMKTIGVGNVSEPCGYISSREGTCLLNRTVNNGITLSIWKEKEEVHVNE
ncbi:hypothetical protein GC105_10855 [Alkalibaculum sp. M08DMB]|uniref:Cobalt-precorrin 5A hydrolase n=1 Tax=Alkalibaculum sporogenes TaxID=2655001 RepID=A0A6A7KAS6_9FIRM|nr:cobalt-precorrin 5A hydrolase [Alkalibaculum sporogenes]MPW26287.1 hypothetical protein [Alkalibaculum sporogenes]